MKFRHCVIAVIAAATIAACGGSDDAASTTAIPTDISTTDNTVTDITVADTAGSDPSSSAADVSDGTTMCDVFTGGYQPILDDPIAFGEDGWDERAQELVRLATELEQLAPAEQAANAAANVGYFQALADVESTVEFLQGSNDFNVYVIQTCLN